MIRHIVSWQLAAQDDATRDADAEAIRDALESLVGVIPEIRSLVVRRNVVPAEVIAGNWDLVLVGEYDSVEDLVTYVEHPLHQEAVAVVRPRVAARSAVDLEY